MPETTYHRHDTADHTVIYFEHVDLENTLMCETLRALARSIWEHATYFDASANPDNPSEGMWVTYPCLPTDAYEVITGVFELVGIQPNPNPPQITAMLVTDDDSYQNN